MSFTFLGTNVIKVPDTLFNDNYCGGTDGVFNMFSITPTVGSDNYPWLGYNGSSWIPLSSFNQQTCAFTYNHRIGRLIIPTSRQVLSRKNEPLFLRLTITYMGDTDEEIKNWENTLSAANNNNYSNMYFGCGSDNYEKYKIVFPSNPLEGGASENMSRKEAGDNDPFTLGVSQGEVDEHAQLEFRQVVAAADKSTNPVTSDSYLYISNCKGGTWSNFQYKMNSPLIARSADRGSWYLSLNPLDWQTDENDKSFGRNNLEKFFRTYPALFICNPDTGVCEQNKLPDGIDYDPKTQLSEDDCYTKCPKNYQCGYSSNKRQCLRIMDKCTNGKDNNGKKCYKGDNSCGNECKDYQCTGPDGNQKCTEVTDKCAFKKNCFPEDISCGGDDCKSYFQCEVNANSLQTGNCVKSQQCNGLNCYVNDPTCNSKCSSQIPVSTIYFRCINDNQGGKKCDSSQKACGESESNCYSDIRKCNDECKPEQKYFECIGDIGKQTCQSTTRCTKVNPSDNCFDTDDCGNTCRTIPSKGWAYRNGVCMEVSDCKSGECSESKEQCIKKNTPSKVSVPASKSYTVLWIILFVLLIGAGLAWFFLRKRRKYVH